MITVHFVGMNTEQRRPVLKNSQQRVLAVSRTNVTDAAPHYELSEYRWRTLQASSFLSPSVAYTTPASIKIRKWISYMWGWALGLGSVSSPELQSAAMTAALRANITNYRRCVNESFHTSQRKTSEDRNRQFSTVVLTFYRDFLIRSNAHWHYNSNHHSNSVNILRP